jgi:uncharacterized protein (DUF2062 family)
MTPPKPRIPLRQRLRGLLQLDDTPRSIGWGTFWGTFISWLPLLGLQTVLALVLPTLFGGNRLACMTVTWVLPNPLTLVPMFWLDYLAGAALLRVGGVALEPWTEARLAALFEHLGSLGLVDAFRELAAAGVSLLGPMLLGGVLVGAATGGILGGIVYAVVTKRRGSRHEHTDGPGASDSPAR